MMRNSLSTLSDDYTSFNLFGGSSIWLPNECSEMGHEILLKCKNKNLKFFAQLYCPLYFGEDIVHRFIYLFYCPECNEVRVNELSKIEKKEEILDKSENKEKTQIFSTNWDSDDDDDDDGKEENSNSFMEQEFSQKLTLEEGKSLLKSIPSRDWLTKEQSYLSIDEECTNRKLSIADKKGEKDDWNIEGKKNEFKDVDDESENDEYKFNFYNYLNLYDGVIMRYIATNKCVFEYKTMEEACLDGACERCGEVLKNEIQLMQNISINFFDCIPKDISSYLSHNSFTFVIRSCKSYKHFACEWTTCPLDVIRIK
ncbi:hypothetical protein SNEBB_008490, partial [Seison nebaliae]